LRNYHSSNTTKNASRLQTAVSVSIRIPTIRTSADAAQLAAKLMAVTSCLRTILMLRQQNKATGNNLRFYLMKAVSSLNKGYVVFVTSLLMSVDQPILPRVFVI